MTGKSESRVANGGTPANVQGPNRGRSADRARRLGALVAVAMGVVIGGVAMRTPVVGGQEPTTPQVPQAESQSPKPDTLEIPPADQIEALGESSGGAVQQFFLDQIGRANGDSSGDPLADAMLEDSRRRWAQYDWLAADAMALEQPTSDAQYRVAEQLLRSARMLKSLEGNDPERVGLIRQMRLQAAQLINQATGAEEATFQP